MTWLVFLAGGVEVGRCIFHGEGYPEAALYGGQVYTQVGVSKDSAGAVHLVTMKQVQLIAPDMGVLDRVFDAADVLEAVTAAMKDGAASRDAEMAAMEKTLGQINTAAAEIEAKIRGAEARAAAATRERDVYRAHLERLGEAVEQRREAIRHRIGSVVKNLGFVAPEARSEWLREKLEGLADPMGVTDARSIAGAVAQLVATSTPIASHFYDAAELRKVTASALCTAEKPCAICSGGGEACDAAMARHQGSF